jgi:hypothetical protein
VIYLVSLLPLLGGTESVFESYSNNREKEWSFICRLCTEIYIFSFYFVLKYKGRCNCYDFRSQIASSITDWTWNMLHNEKWMAVDESKQNVVFIHSATSWQVARLIPDGVIGIFHWLNPSGHTMALWSTEASNRNEYQGYLLGGRGGRCVGLTTLSPSCTV